MYTDSTTVAKTGRTERIRTSDPLLPKQMHYQAVLLSDVSILLYLVPKVKWWDHLDLNQESTNYEFAALTNYAIVPKVHSQIQEATYDARRHAICLEDTFSYDTKSRDSQDDIQSIQHSSE